jgi:hypothetical protein
MPCSAWAEMCSSRLIWCWSCSGLGRQPDSLRLVQHEPAFATLTLTPLEGLDVNCLESFCGGLRILVSVSQHEGFSVHFGLPAACAHSSAQQRTISMSLSLAVVAEAALGCSLSSSAVRLRMKGSKARRLARSPVGICLLRPIVAGQDENSMQVEPVLTACKFKAAVMAWFRSQIAYA